MKNIYFLLFRINRKAGFLFLVLGVMGCNYSFAQALNIGVITDYKYDELQQNTLKRNIREEVAKTIGSSAQLSLLDKNIVAADYNAIKINNAYTQLSASCDVIVLVGIKSTKTILESKNITRPTIALGITNTAIQNIPLTEKGTSGVDNFSYILTSRSLEQELNQFYELFPYKKLSVLIYQEMVNTIGKNKFEKGIEALSQKLNCTIYPVVLDDDIAKSLVKIPADTDAVFLGTTFEISREDIQVIVDYLKVKAIPSYSPLQQYVEAGILSGVSSEKDAKSIFRKLGLMIDEIRRGENAKDLQVSLGQKKQLYFNVETSKAIHFSPTFQTLFTANLINGEADSNEFTYSLTEILEKAINANLGVQISYKDIALSEQDIREAKSHYLPTVNVGVQASQINEEATNEFIGQSECSIIQSTNASQLIYSESVIANIKIQKLLNEAQKYTTKQEVNYTIFRTYQLYLNILFAKSNVDIQKENLEVLKKNLELAELQADIGAKIKSDVYRWKSEVANATQRLIEAQTGLIITKESLNTFLNNTLDNDFDIEDIHLENNLFDYYDSNLLVNQIKNPQDVKKISQYLYEYASSNFPGVKQLEYAIKALERQKKSNNRAFYLPNVSLGVNQSEILHRSGVASEPTGNFSNFIDSYWNVGLTLTFPLFEGNRKNIKRQQTAIQTEQLTLQKKELVNGLKLNIQNSIANLISGKTNIVLSEKSAENAQKNFEILQKLYLENSISIVPFFDAQNAALNAKLIHVNSVYAYIMSFVELENSIGFFSMLASTEEKQKFEESLNQSINK
ncbi:TolC family protein [Flavivirga sp. 57AJ16]|uniref:TolC family protein n=1 Tax=Flavivirga sp. 57AJ16 TaxID=3025307 RepID=UPI0023671700|nr:TolC family protein [Flavivirga sp. 57AJ16]MDD7886930.1 TolC family protein [Flavivirga sp. 57AJ16]